MDERQAQEALSSPLDVRIDWRRLMRWLVLTLIVPVLLAIASDLLIGTLPILTLVTSLICIPVATIFVGRAILSEMDRVLTVLAPEVPEPDGDAIDHSKGAGSSGASA